MNNGANTVSILLRDGDGTFQSHTDYATGTSPFPVLAGDFNGDGNLDFAVANHKARIVSTLLGYRGRDIPGPPGLQHGAELGIVVGHGEGIKVLI